VIKILPTFILKILELLSLSIFLTCLYIISDIIKLLKPGTLAKGVVYLTSGIPLRSLKVIMTAVTLWIIKEGVIIIGSFWNLKFTGFNEIAVVVISLILSYGLYLLTIALKGAKKELKGKTNS
jgi:hypothetical protein